MKQSTGVVGFPEGIGHNVRKELLPVINPGKLYQGKAGKIIQDLAGTMDAMSIEAHTGYTHRTGEIEVAARCENPRKLFTRLHRAERVKFIAVTSEPDVLSDMEARERMH